jgi:hypothetical protein
LRSTIDGFRHRWNNRCCISSSNIATGIGRRGHETRWAVRFIGAGDSRMIPRVGKRSTREGSSEMVRKGPLANSEPGALRRRKRAAERRYMGQHSTNTNLLHLLTLFLRRTHLRGRCKGHARDLVRSNTSLEELISLQVHANFLMLEACAKLGRFFFTPPNAVRPGLLKRGGVFPSVGRVEIVTDGATV